jgi:hypothetical protein
MRTRMREFFGFFESVFHQPRAVFVFEFDVIEQPAVATQSARKAQRAASGRPILGRGLRIGQKRPSST